VEIVRANKSDDSDSGNHARGCPFLWSDDNGWPGVADSRVHFDNNMHSAHQKTLNFSKYVQYSNSYGPRSKKNRKMSVIGTKTAQI
jgi:hypothetical protein